LRTFVPEVVDAVLLHIHGGGFTLGDPEMGDQGNSLLSTSLNLAVVSVDYRLAPEHPYPAAHDDCEAAAVWLLEHADRQFGSERLLIGGESAGAHLAAATLLRVRDRHDAIDRFAGANLAFGVYDLASGTPSQHGVGAGPDVLHAAGFEPTRRMFTPGVSEEARRDPDVSPLYADLSNLPPALFTTGTADHLFNDTLFMAVRWRAAGNRVQLLAYPGGPHGCTQLPTVSGHWTPRLLEFFRNCLTPR
jgi:acetyl esterase/lipase